MYKRNRHRTRKGKRRKRTQKVYKQRGGNFAHTLSSIPIIGSFLQDGVNVFRGGMTTAKNIGRRWKGRKDAVSPLPYKNQLRHKPSLIVSFPNVKKTLNRNKQYVKGINVANKKNA